MSKKKVPNRLESLFADLEQESAFLNEEGGTRHPSFEPEPGSTSGSSRDISLPSLRSLSKPWGYVAKDGQTYPSNTILESGGSEGSKQGDIFTKKSGIGGEQAITLSADLKDGVSNLLIEIADDDNQRRWSEDERLLVEQVVDQLSLALENARLFEQNQKALAETEALYQASAKLNASSNYNDILSVLRRYTILGSDNISNILVSIFDQPWYGENKPDWLTPIARWPAEISLPPSHDRYQISSWSTLDLLLHPDLPTVIEDVVEDSRLDDVARSLYVDQLQAKSLLFAPLNVGGKWIGHIIVVFRQPTIFSEAEIRRLMSLVGQAAMTVESIRLLAQTQNTLAETEALYQASSQINAAQNYDDILAALSEYSFLGQGDSVTTIDLFDRPWSDKQVPEWIIVLARRSIIPVKYVRSRYRLQSFPSAPVFLKPESPTLISDVESDSRLDETVRTILNRSFKAQSAIFAPLLAGGQWIGYINGIFRGEVEFHENQVRRLMVLASQAAVAIQNIHLLEETRRRADQLQTAAEIARDASSTLALDDLLGRAVELIRNGFNYDQVMIFLINEPEPEAVVHAATGEAGKELIRRGYKLAIGSKSLIGHVTQRGESLVVNDVVQEPNYRPNPLLPQTMAELGIPMKIGDRVIGALDVQSNLPNIFSPEDISVLQILADQITVAVDNARSYGLAQQAVEEMRKADQLKGQFLANMSHELRTPLNSIIGFSRVIIKGIDGPVTPLQHQDLTAIYHSGQHLLNLINDILDLSKIEAGKMELSLEEGVNLTDLANSVISTASGLIKDKPIQLRREIAPNLPLVRVDTTRIRQVLINLLSNAAKFTDEGSITVEAGVQAGPAGRPEVIISVTDTGTGIKPEDQAKLFLPFSQVDPSPTRKTGGSGLGLSISRHLVEMHGGSIGVSSEPAKGSKFFFSLPVYIPSYSPTNPGSQGEKSLRTGSVILTIDDERQVLNLYERYLEENGYQVFSLTDPTRAVEIARQIQPFAITLDIMMPGRDGWQVLNDLKADPLTQHIPVILCTVQEEQGRGFSLGVTDYLRKPILEEDLISAIHRLNGDGSVYEILVVDDDPDDLRLVQKIFREQDQYRIRIARGGRDAMVAIRAQPPHAIILDLFMTDLDGFTLLETLRADSFLRDIPVVIFTASDLDEGQLKRLKDFSQAMLYKGQARGEELLATIGQTLERLDKKSRGVER